MGVSKTTMVSYECDHEECDTVRAAAPGVAPKGVLFRIDPLTLGILDSHGRVFEGCEDFGQGYSCGQQHVGRAVAAVIKRDSLTADAAHAAAGDGEPEGNAVGLTDDADAADEDGYDGPVPGERILPETDEPDDVLDDEPAVANAG